MVSAGFGQNTDRWNVVCASLPEPIVEAIRQVTQEQVCWFFGSERELVRRLGWIVEQFRLPGLALIWNAMPFPPTQRSPVSEEMYMDPPAPLELPFEPTPLSEGASTTAALVSAGASPGQADRGQTSPWFVGWSCLQVLAVLAIVLTPCLLLSCCGFLVPVGMLEILGVVGAVGGLFGALGIWAMRRRSASGQWFLVPGGVVVRRQSLMRARVVLDRYTPADSVLLVLPRPPGWLTTLGQGRRRIRQLLSPQECVALLRAWQCPLPPPEIVELEDLT